MKVGIIVPKSLSTSATIYFFMDEKDQVIISTLKSDASLSVSKIATKTKLPSTTVYNRIKKMKESNIIRNYTINVDKDILYGKIVAFILIKVNQSDQRSIVKRLMERNEIEEAAIITGETDILVKIRVFSIDDLDQFIIDELRKIPGIQESRTLISLENYERM